MTDDELIERMRAIPFIGFEDRGQQGTQDASICHDAADRIKAMSERVAELEGVLQSGLKVIEQELRHLLESCCLIDKETLEPIRETLEDGPSENVEIGRAHVCNTITNAHLVRRLLLE